MWQQKPSRVGDLGVVVVAAGDHTRDVIADRGVVVGHLFPGDRHPVPEGPVSQPADDADLAPQLRRGRCQDPPSGVHTAHRVLDGDLLQTGLLEVALGAAQGG